MVEIFSPNPISIDDFVNENWQLFDQFKEAATEGIRKFAREMPPELHDELRKNLFEELLNSNALHQSRLRVRLAIDTNIILQDAFRVGNGKPSTTGRLLKSPYVEVVAPTVIWEEVERNIRTYLPKGASLEKALGHAKALLECVKPILKVSSRALELARQLISTHSPEDVPLLAVAIDTEASAVLSRDKRAFDNQPHVKRWELGKGAEVITAYEAGSLSLTLLGASVEVLGDVLQRIAFEVAGILEEILNVAIAVIQAIVYKTAEALSKVPGWAWAIIIGAAFGLGIVAALVEDFRNWLMDGLGRFADSLKPILEAFTYTVKAIWSAFRLLLVIAWNILIVVAPFAIVAAGVLASNARKLIELVEKESQRARGIGG